MDKNPILEKNSSGNLYIKDKCLEFYDAILMSLSFTVNRCQSCPRLMCAVSTLSNTVVKGVISIVYPRAAW